MTKARNAAAGPCGPSDYRLTATRMPVDAVLEPRQKAPFTGARIGFYDKSVNQDACKGATVALVHQRMRRDLIAAVGTGARRLTPPNRRRGDRRGGALLPALVSLLASAVGKASPAGAYWSGKGNPIAGAPVSFSTRTGTDGASGVVTGPTTVTTGSDGIAEATVQAGDHENQFAVEGTTGGNVRPVTASTPTTDAAPTTPTTAPTTATTLTGTPEPTSTSVEPTPTATTPTTTAVPVPPAGPTGGPSVPATTEPPPSSTSTGESPASEPVLVSTEP